MAGRSSATPATRLLDRRGVSYRLHVYPHDPGTRQFGAEAVERLGLPADRVFKTLLVDTGAGLAVAVLPVARSLDLKALAAALGVKKVALADPATAERVTGMVRGGISPLGQRQRLPTVLDATAHCFATVFVSAGRRGRELEVAPDDLVALTGAVVVPIGRT